MSKNNGHCQGESDLRQKFKATGGRHKEECDGLWEDLGKYCGMDTLGMVMILKKLQGVIG